MAKIAADMVKLFRPTNARIMETLTPNSEVLEIITQDFHSMMRSQETERDVSINITCYAEELAVSRFGKSFMVRQAKFPEYYWHFVNSFCF